MPVEKQTVRAAIAVVISNPYAGGYAKDLSPLIPFSQELGRTMGKKLVEEMGGKDKVESYGKAGVVGEDGELEHLEFVMHGKLAAGFREYVGSLDEAKVLIESTERVGTIGTPLYIPLRFKTGASVNHLDTMTVIIPDAPRRDEMVLAVAGGTGPRPLSRLPPEFSVPQRT